MTLDTKIQHLCATYEYWYFDTCSWMSENIDAFLENAVHIFKEQGRQIILFDEVEKELLRHAAKRTRASIADSHVVYKADHALNIIDRLDSEGLILRIKTASSKYADRNIIESIIHLLGDYKMVVVTSDRCLARDIFQHIHGVWYTMDAKMVTVQWINKIGRLTNWCIDNELNSFQINNKKICSTKIRNFVRESER